FGYSVFAVRLPSVVFTVLTCVAVYILAWQANLRAPLLAAVLYAISPLTMRYAVEARPYAQAALGLFTQPYSIFVSVAHLLWVVLVKRNVRAAWLAGTAVAVASLAFLP